MSMRMRQSTYYLKLATRADLVATGEALALVATVENAVGETFARALDGLEIGAEPVDLGAGRDSWLASRLTGPLHMRARVRLEGAPDGALHSLEINATSHPYTGAHVTVVDVRLSIESPGALSVLETCLDDAIKRLDLTWAGIHESDDNAVQNCESPVMLRLGYGVDPATVESDRPGREVSRGEFRYVADWRGYLGPAVLDRIAPFGTDPRPAWVVERGSGIEWRLTEHPRDVATPDGRAAQRELARALGFEAAARADRWTWGFFDKREPGRSVDHGDR